MPYKSKYRYRRKKKFNRKKYSRRGFSRMKRNRDIVYIKREGKNLYNFITNGQVSNIPQLTTGTETVYNLCFRLQDLPSYTDFNIFDQYRVKAIKVNFIPVCNMSDQSVIGVTGGVGSTTPLPPGAFAVRSYTALDFNDDNTGVSTVDAIREYNNCKWKPYNRIHTRYFYPKIQAVGGGTTAFNLREKPWINIASPSAEHFGIIFGIDPTTAVDNTVLYKIEYKAYLQFRQAK